MPSDRKTIRQAVRKQRQQLSLPQRQFTASALQAHIVKLPLFQQAKHVALYFSHHNEVDTAPLWQSCCVAGKSCYFPVLIQSPDKHLIFLPHQEGERLQKNRYGILEPTVSHDKAIDIFDLDVIFIPLVAFDVRANRLGMGVGYYDRTLIEVVRQAATEPLLIGLAYEMQKVKQVPMADWDVPMSAVVTEETVYWR
ncbi:MAG: 5-formyltetrahydrofolate cyclo-ligase, partial [Gammaproteobacteria bacterium]